MMSRKRKHKPACLVGAACKDTPPTPPEATETESTRGSLKTGSSLWRAPKEGRLKLNFSGSCKPKRSSIGGVYRDHEGKLVLGYAQRIGKTTTFMAELVALKRGLELALANGWRDISIQGNWKVAIDAMAGRVPFGAKENLELYMEIAAMLPQLGEATVSHVIRKGNRVARSFAKLGHRNPTLRLWHDIPQGSRVLQRLEQDASELKEDEDEKQSCLIGASCAADLATLLAATESKRRNLKSKVLQHLDQGEIDATEPRENDEPSCLIGASCKAAPTTPLAATIESKQRNVKRGAPTTLMPPAAIESKRQNLRSGGSSSSSSIWTAPMEWRLKLNFDGSSMEPSTSKPSTIGGVYRDHKGKFILGYTQQIGTATSSVAELVALKRGLELAMMNGWRDISIEGDFKPGIDVITSGVPLRVKEDLEHYMEIATILPLLGETTVSHVLRKGNKVANGFAELGLESETGTLRLWPHIPPDEVLRHLEEDAQKCITPIVC